MEKGCVCMMVPSFQQTVGFSVQDTLSLFWLHSTSEQATYPRELFDNFLIEFPGRRVGYEYVARIGARLEKEGSLTSFTNSRKKYYHITELGKKRLQEYQKTYFQRFSEITAVIDRFYYQLTKNGVQPSGEVALLHDDFRSYLAKLLSVKDVVRYMALHISLSRSSFYMAQVEDQLNALFGWAPSNGYLYQIARDMEEQNLLVGYWPDERRTVRYLHSTEEGAAFYRVVSQSLTERITHIRGYLHYIMAFLDKPGGSQT